MLELLKLFVLLFSCIAICKIAYFSVTGGPVIWQQYSYYSYLGIVFKDNLKLHQRGRWISIAWGRYGSVPRILVIINIDYDFI